MLTPNGQQLETNISQSVVEISCLHVEQHHQVFQPKAEMQCSRRFNASAIWASKLLVAAMLAKAKNTLQSVQTSDNVHQATASYGLDTNDSSQRVNDNIKHV